MWLKVGNLNTKFLHEKANQRRKVNEIKKLKDKAGVWWKMRENVENTCEVVRGKESEDNKIRGEQVYTEEERLARPFIKESCFLLKRFC